MIVHITIAFHEITFYNQTHKNLNLIKCRSLVRDILHQSFVKRERNTIYFISLTEGGAIQSLSTYRSMRFCVQSKTLYPGEKDRSYFFFSLFHKSLLFIFQKEKVYIQTKTFMNKGHDGECNRTGRCILSGDGPGYRSELAPFPPACSLDDGRRIFEPSSRSYTRSLLFSFSTSLFTVL